MRLFSILFEIDVCGLHMFFYFFDNATSLAGHAVLEILFCWRTHRCKFGEFLTFHQKFHDYA